MLLLEQRIATKIQRIYVEGKKLKVFSSDLNKNRMSNSFYSLLIEKKKAELREADIAHKYYQCIF